MTTVPNNPPLPPSLRFIAISSIDIDVDDQKIIAHGVAEAAPGYPVDIDMTLDPGTDPELTAAINALSKIVVARIHEPMLVPRELKCDSCSSACCTKFSQVLVHGDDVPGLIEATGLANEQALRDRGILVGTGIGGAIGYLGRVDTSDVEEIDEDDVCGFLTWEKNGVGRCSIYAHRPYTCRSYPERSCEEKKPPVPALYKIRPRGKASFLFDTRPAFDLVAYNKMNPPEAD